jgi:mannose-6-phosphate isomerase
MIRFTVKPNPNFTPMYPLRFEPLFRRYLWGGRRLAKVLDKPIGDESAAESWEIVDHGPDQSVVAFGPLAGTTLHQLVVQQGEELLGRSLAAQLASDAVPSQLRGRFPLLLKFLDANKDLSVQVHPDDTFGATLDPPDLGKTEAWYVMHTDPGAKIYSGLKEGTTKETFRQAIDQDHFEDVLHSFEPAAGDCVFIPAGTMHAIGAGLLIAEIQQASDTTFRIYDWGRVDKDGKSRPLHIDQGVKATDFSQGPVNASEAARLTDEHGQPFLQLVSCDKFVMNRRTVDGAIQLGGDGRFRILAVTKGSVEVENDPSSEPLRFGQTILLPASLPATQVTATQTAEILEILSPTA